MGRFFRTEDQAQKRILKFFQIMLISVIIPCYNVEEYIAECIQSVVAQEYSGIEIICIDNGSSDKTWNILEEHREKYGIRIDKEPKPGASCARNKGLQMAKGEWIQFLDADDLLLPFKIAHQAEILKSSPGLAFIAGGCFRQTVAGDQTKMVPAPDDRFKALFITKLGNTCSNFFNAELLRMAGGWNDALKSSQESDLMFRLLKRKKDVVYDPEPLT